MKHVHVQKEIKSKMAPPAKPSELVGTVGNSGNDTLYKISYQNKNHQGQTDYQEQRVVTLLMCTKTNKVTVEAVPLLKENETRDQEWN